MPSGVQGTIVFWTYCFVAVPFCPAPLRRPAVRTDSTRPWYVRVLESTGRDMKEVIRSWLLAYKLSFIYRWILLCNIY